MLGRVIDPAARLRYPQLDPVMLEQRRHQRVLGAVEGPLVLADDDRVPAPARARQGPRSARRPAAAGPRPACGSARCRRRRPRPARARPPAQPPALAAVPGMHRVLMIFRGHPPVERESQLPAGSSGCPSAAGALRPRRQHILALPRRLTFQATSAASPTAHRPTLQVQTRHGQGQTSGNRVRPHLADKQHRRPSHRRTRTGDPSRPRATPATIPTPTYPQCPRLTKRLHKVTTYSGSQAAITLPTQIGSR